MTMTYAVLKNGYVITRGKQESIDQFRERVEMLKHKELRGIK